MLKVKHTHTYAHKPAEGKYIKENKKVKVEFFQRNCRAKHRITRKIIIIKYKQRKSKATTAAAADADCDVDVDKTNNVWEAYTRRCDKDIRREWEGGQQCRKVRERGSYNNYAPDKQTQQQQRQRTKRGAKSFKN